MGFRFQRLEIPELLLGEAKAFEDQRGFFMETYNRSEFSAIGVPEVFVQDNYSHSRRGVLRGLHYQKQPRAQAKLVMAFKGEMFDVALDIRKGSPTYGQWVGVVLSSKKRQMLYIPVGFAHGFCVLSKDANIVYKVTEEYAPELERGIVWDDPEIGIRWPIEQPILSPKDARLPPLKEADNDFVYEERRS